MQQCEIPSVGGILCATAERDDRGDEESGCVIPK